MGLELSGSFALGNRGWAKCNDFFFYIILRGYQMKCHGFTLVN